MLKQLDFSISISMRDGWKKSVEMVLIEQLVFM